MSDTYDRTNGMQSATRQNEPAPKPTVAPGKRTLTQGLSRGDARPRVPVQQKRAPVDEETRERDEAARRQRDAEIQRSMEIAVRPDLYQGSLEHEADEDPSSAPVVQQESTRALQATGAPVQRQEAPDAGELAQRQEAPQASAPVSSSEDEGLARVRILLAQGWVGPLDEAEIERIWGSFGPHVLDVAERNRALWDQSIEHGAELDELPAVEATRAKFRADVCLLAHEILRRNEAHVLAEMQALGVVPDDGAIDPASAVIPAEEQEEHLAHLRWCAYQLLAARHALDELRQVPVGYGPVASDFGVDWVQATFDPAQPPPLGHDADVSAAMHGAAEMRPWDEVKAHHDRLQAVVAALAGESPALYAAASRDSTVRLAEMSGSPAKARRAMEASLRELLANIRATMPKLGGDLDDRDLTPLHERLFQGASGASGIDWSNPLHQSIAREVVEGHEDAQFWLSLGLGTAAAAAFVVAELATFGGATFFIAGGAGLAAGGAMAARGWEQWDDLSTAANASTGEQGQIVSQAQADAALTSAVIDSAFAFLDVVPALQAVRAATAARHGIATAAGQGMETLARGGETSGALVARDGASEGVEQVTKQSGEATGGTVADDAASAGIEQAARQSESSGGLVARDAAGEGIEGATEQGVATTSKRLKPQDAANWQEISGKYLGKNIEEVGVPPGYVKRTNRDGVTFLSRIVGDDRLFVQLHLEDGVIHVGPTPSPRVSNTASTKLSVGQILDGKGLAPRPPHHQAHHVVPDEVVRKHPLMREAHRRGLFMPDAPENIALLAERRANGMVPDKVPGLSEGLPRHQGSHGVYSDDVMDAATRVLGRLLQHHGTLDKVPDEALKKAASDVLEESWEILKNWDGPHLE